MPQISLVVCVYKERDLLERLLQKSAGCYDHLVVVHDGQDTTNVRALVEAVGGRFFERPRAYQQEPHWPFAWEQAKHDWILRLDADEFPSNELKEWLQNFRKKPEPPSDVSGYTCIWPLWNGKRTVTKCWPAGRNFLFNRQRVRFFGMAETVPYPDFRNDPLPIVLHHQPKRQSYGLRNIVFRKQASHWRRVIAESLMQTPTALPCWRWTSEKWPSDWESLRIHTLRTSFFRLFWFPLCQVKDMLRAGEMPRPSACLNPGVHHFMLGIRVFFEKLRRRS